MSIRSQIYSRLSGYAGLTALVSTRIYPALIPQGAAMPAVTFTLVSATRPSAFGSDPGRVRARFQVDCWSDQAAGSTSGADLVAEQVRAALQRWRTSSGSPEIFDSFIENSFETYEPETKIHRVSIDIIIWHGE